MRKNFIVGAVLAAAITVSASAAGFNKTNTYTDGFFTDVPTTEWYAEEVKNTYELGLMNGTGAGVFNPNGNVTVAEAITMAARASSIYSGETIAPAEGEWYEMYVAYAKAKGFVKDGKFDDYNRAAKRYEVADIFTKAMPQGYFAAKNNVTAIPDVPASRDYASNILTLYKAGVVMGSDAVGNFLPENNIIRAEAAAIINRVALPENRLSKTLDKVTNDDAYALILATSMNGSNEGVASGWILDNRGGVPRTDLMESYGTIYDIDETAGSVYYREFNEIDSGVVTLQSKIVADGDGVFLSFADKSEKEPYRIEIIDGNFCIYTAEGTEKIYKNGNRTDFEFVIRLDFDNNYSETYINGFYCGKYPLIGKASAVNFKIGTTDKSTATVSIGSTMAYGNYVVFEDFNLTTSLSLPMFWNYDEGTTVSNNALLIPGGKSAFRGFTPVSGKVIAEVQTLLPSHNDIEYTLKSSGKDVLTLTTAEENGSYVYKVNGETVYTGAYKNMWYRFRFELDTDKQTVRVKLNGREVAPAIPFINAATSVDSFTYKNNSGENILADDFKIFREIEHSDYVPKPVVPEGADDYTIGLTVCSLWRNGLKSWYEWSKITPFKDHTLALGWYDEGNPEAADWEIKYMVEHGIDFQEFCVFFGWGGVQRLEDHHLYEGYMNAKYSDMMNFAVIFECTNGDTPSDMQTWKTSFVPYLIENYFKDPRYMKIDDNGKELLVITFFDANAFIKELKDDNGVGGKPETTKAAFDYLEDEVRRLGLADGILFLTNGNQGPEYAAAGFKGTHNYTRGTEGSRLDYNIAQMYDEGPLFSIPTATVGFNMVALSNHGRIRTDMMSISDYRKQHDYIKNTYMKEHPGEGWSKNLLYVTAWNEYGEGYYLMPLDDEEYGFGYLDTLRETYTKAGAADAKINAMPTAEQKDRITHLYPQYRRLLRKEGYVKEEVKNDFVVSYKMEMGKVEGLVEWGGHGIFEQNPKKGVTFYPGNAVMDLFLSTKDMGINIDTVDAIRIKARSNEHDSLMVYYTTTKNESLSQDKCLSYTFKSGKLETITFDVTEATDFEGALTSIRFVGGLPGDERGLLIESVEFLSNKAAANKNITINGNVAEMFFEKRTSSNGKTLVAFDPAIGMDFMLNAFHLWNKDTGVLELRFKEHTVVYTVGKDTYTLDGKEKSLGFTLELLDGLPLIPIDMLCEDVGYKFSLDGAGSVQIETDQMEYFENKRAAGTPEEDYVWEFNEKTNIEGWMSSYMNLAATGEYMSCQAGTSSNDPVIYYENPTSMNAEDYKAIEMRVRYKYFAATPASIQMYFGTTTSGMSEANSIVMKLQSTDSQGEWETYRVDLTQLSTWKGTVTGLRLDPFNAIGNMDIDYIRFIK